MNIIDVDSICYKEFHCSLFLQNLNSKMCVKTDSCLEEK